MSVTPTVIDLPGYDGTMPFDIWKAQRQRKIKELAAKGSPLLNLRDKEGKPLYKLTSGWNLVRTNPLSKSRRNKVIERDKQCVWCAAGGPFEVDHIIRYADGGSNELDNLQTLCEPCHRSKGGK